MRCPICYEDVSSTEQAEKWGPEWAHANCVTAYKLGNAMGSEEQERLLRDALEALEQATTGWNHEHGKWLHVSIDAFPVVDASITAIRKHLGDKT